ncbi:hypothetical protein PTKIN_Ptkin15bG0100900 [Pterospermum kingtungense]
MTDEIKERWRSLKLTDKEDDNIETGEIMENGSIEGCNNWLVGKLLTHQPFNKEAMIGTMKAIWKLHKEVNILAIEENLFIFKFQGERDKNRILKGAPWSFDKHLLLLNGFEGELHPEQYVFKNAQFWIRIYDMPLGMRTKGTTKKIGRKIRRLLTIDESLTEGGWATFMRMKVKVDITKPLRRAVKLLDPMERKKI